MNSVARIVNMFCVISTGIFLCSGIYCYACCGADVELHLSYIFGVFLIAFISSVLYIPFLKEDEFSKGKLIALRILYFLIINILVLVVGYKLDWFIFGNIKMLVGMELAVVAVFSIVFLVEYLRSLQEAKKMNLQIANRQKE
ncbi:MULTISPECIES: DUF3021 family protein [unclassified Treponema]|uniref:DUF3021 family protein n=1 Tax=unclassified Treponema TaxID=2638727 RepID=UPI000E82E49C|nr:MULTISPECIES: DUF3021 family protein [unclassified Treponema]HBP09471.1 hypothetical protein [Treponema sp.]